ncbi:unnamed protein product, partial [Closterium sp. NIES-54]
SEGLGFESQCVHFGHSSAGGCQGSTAPPVPPEPPAPPAPLAPAAPPAPPAPPAPLAPPNPSDIGASAHQRPVLQLYLPATFDEWLSEPDTPKAPDMFIQAPPHVPRWGQPEACTWDEPVVGADDDVAADKQYSGDDDGVGDDEAGANEDVFPDRGASAEDDDGVESWWRDAPREKMPIPTAVVLRCGSSRSRERGARPLCRSNRGRSSSGCGSSSGDITREDADTDVSAN